MSHARRALVLSALATLGLASTAKAAPKKKAEAGASSASFVIVPAVTATIAPDLRRAGLLQVQAGLSVRDPAQEEAVNRAMPRLRDAFRTEAQTFVNSFYRAGGVPDVDILARMFQQAADRTIGAGARVLMVAVIIR
jgi:hypothetical protein